MTEADKEKVADRMLREAHAGTGEYPAYSEHYLKHHRDYQRGKIVETVSLTDAEMEVIQSASLAELLNLMRDDLVWMARDAKCDEFQIEILLRFCQEKTLQEIADDMAVSKSLVAVELLKVKRKLRTHPYAGLFGVLAEAFCQRVAEIIAMLRDGW